MQRTRCAYNHCNGWSGRGKSLSNSLMWCAGDEQGIKSVGIVVKDSEYMHACRNNVHWEQSPGGWVESPRRYLSDHVDWDR